MPSIKRFLQSPSSNQFPASDPPLNLNMDSDVVIILASLLCALVCIVGLAIVVRCACIRHTLHISSQSRPIDRGIKKKVLDSLPKLSFNVNDDSYNNMTEDCAICLAEFENGDEIKVLLWCAHGFHVVCIDMRLGAHASCPSCRQILVVPVPSTCQKCGSGSTAEVGCGGDSRYLP